MKLLVFLTLSFALLQNALAINSCRKLFPYSKENFELGAVNASDLETVVAILTDPRSVAMSGDDHDRASVKSILQTSSTHNRDIPRSPTFILGYRDIRSGQLVGFISVYGFSVNARASFGYGVHPQHWGEGIATMMNEVFFEYAVKNLGLRSLEAQTLQTNAASNRLLLKLGFKKTGEAPFHLHQIDNLYFRNLIEP